MFLFGIIFNGEVLKLRNIYDLTRKEFEDYFVSIGDKKFRSVQLYEFLYKKRINNTSEMNNIGNNIKERLNKDFSFYMIKLIVKQEDNLVKKYLFELIDGERIESVVMFHDYGISVCVSSQVGCNMSCAFCESGRLKKRRNLEAYEIVEQILLIEQDIGKRISHIVVMGIGEPFDNYDNIIRFINIINNPKGLALGSRHITVSTCGIVPKIKEFTKEKTGVNFDRIADLAKKAQDAEHADFGGKILHWDMRAEKPTLYLNSAKNVLSTATDNSDARDILISVFGQPIKKFGMHVIAIK